MVLSSGLSFICPRLKSVKHLVWGGLGGLRDCMMTLLCLLLWMLFMCSFVQHESRHRHLSFSLSGQWLHNGEMSCLKS